MPSRKRGRPLVKLDDKLSRITEQCPPHSGWLTAAKMPSWMLGTISFHILWTSRPSFSPCPSGVVVVVFHFDSGGRKGKQSRPSPRGRFFLLSVSTRRAEPSAKPCRDAFRFPNLRRWPREPSTTSCPPAPQRLNGGVSTLAIPIITQTRNWLREMECISFHSIPFHFISFHFISCHFKASSQ